MNRIGSLTFEVPEGYTVKTVDQNYVNIEKDGEDTSISIKRSTEDDIAWLEDENGNAPTTLEEAFAIQTKNVDKNDDSQKVTIAGREGYMEEFGSGEGEKHVIQAHFLTDDALYTVELSTKQKDDYSEDKETFKAFIDTLKME